MNSKKNEIKSSIKKDPKKIMILGAGVYQVPLIKTARRMGLYTIVVSIPGEYPGFALADQTYLIDTRDKEAILRAAEKEKISGICTAGTDVAVVSVGYVCEKMGLAGLSAKSAACVTDKKKMKEAFLRGGVSTAKCKVVSTAEEAVDAAVRTGFPVVVKRVDSSGSRGITFVESPLDVKAAFEKAQKGSLKDYVLVEELLTGREIGVDGIVQDGKVVFLAPHEKFVYHGKQINVPAGHGFPLRLTDEQTAEIARQMQLAADATGMDDCPFNADVFIDGNKVSVIEIGGRTGATCIPELISMYYGFDFYEKIIRMALGLSLEFPEKEKVPCMAKLLMSPEDGKITFIDEKVLEDIRGQGVEAVLDFPVGHTVEAMSNGTDRIGHVIAAADSEEKFQNIIDQVYRCIYVNNQSLEELWKR